MYSTFAERCPAAIIYTCVCMCVHSGYLLSRTQRTFFVVGVAISRRARDPMGFSSLSLSLSRPMIFFLSCECTRVVLRDWRERERYNRGDENRRAYRAAEIYIMSESAQEFGKKGRLAK